MEGPAHSAEGGCSKQEPEWTESTQWTESTEVYGVPKARSE